jgi:hypothetical protein
MIAQDLVAKSKAAKVSFEFVSPATAKQWLEMNTNNYRKPTDNGIARYASDMGSGRWTINTASIAFLSNGVLFDGQNRLHAIVKSGVGIWTYVFRNCPDEFAEDPNQDKGMIRKATTYLQRDGIKNATTVASAVRCLHRLADGASVARNGATSITDAAMMDIATQMPQVFFDCIDHTCSSKVLKTMFAASLVGSFYYLAIRRDQLAASVFFDVLSKQKDESSSHPANVLREKVITDKKLLSNDAFLSLAFLSFNLMLSGESRKHLRVCPLSSFVSDYNEPLNEVLHYSGLSSAVV